MVFSALGTSTDIVTYPSHGGMSALGQKRTHAVQQRMSALPPKADMCGATRDVRFGPKADIRVRSRLWRYGGKYVVGRRGATDALKRKIAN